MNQSKLKLSVLATALILSACGGGGGGGTVLIEPIKQPDSPVVPTVVPTENSSVIDAGLSTIITSAPPVPTYAIDSAEYSAFTTLNAERIQCGFGPLKQNAKLDTYIKGHIDWQLLTQIPDYLSHVQKPNTPGFTGITYLDRALAVGYITPELYASNHDANGNSVYRLSEGLTGGGERRYGAWGGEAVRVLLSAPYHMMGLLEPVVDIGVAVRDSFDAGVVLASGVSSRSITGILTGSATQERQMQSATDVLTYPCEGSTGVTRLLGAETPNPVPGRNLGINPIGTTVYIQVRENQVIKITSAAMVNATTNAAVVLRAPMTNDVDPNPGYYQLNGAYVSADAPLDRNTRYSVTIQGTNNGVAFTKKFTFTTAV